MIDAFFFNSPPSASFPAGGVNGAGPGLVPAQNVPYLPTKWCVVNPNMGLTELQSNLDYACNHGDCTASYPGGSCSSLTLEGNASYAFNNYFQFTDQLSGSCDFQGLAEVTTTNPSTGTCEFFVGLQPTTAVSSTSDPPPSHPSSSSSSSAAAAKANPPAFLCTLSVAIIAAIVGSWILQL